MESVKICYFKTFRAGNFAFRTFCCFFLHYIHVKKFVCENISAEYEFESERFKGSTHRQDLKLNNLDLSGNTTEFKTLPMRPRSHRYILFYIFAVESVKICRFKTFWTSIFARGTLLLFRCLNIHAKMFVLLRYCARK